MILSKIEGDRLLLVGGANGPESVGDDEGIHEKAGPRDVQMNHFLQSSGVKRPTS